MVSLLEPSLTKPPEPVTVPEPMVKLLTLELTVMPLGVRVPLPVTEVGTPVVSSNST